MKLIKLNRAHNGRPKGTVVEVDDLRGKRMIEDGTGKTAPARKRKPLEKS